MGCSAKFFFTILFGRVITVQPFYAGPIHCRQCTAMSKRTRKQCRSPAMQGKTKCRFHGGRSLGPTSPEGRARCAAAKTLHGQETRAARAERSRDAALIRALESLGYALGIMNGPRMRGKKPQLG